jgi:hypothetical protein
VSTPEPYFTGTVQAGECYNVAVFDLRSSGGHQ